MGLAEEVARFQQWTNAPGNAGKPPEWELNYPHWQALWNATEAALAQPQLDEHELELILFVISRDNEDDWILNGLKEAESPHGMALARAALNYPDKDSRWQMVDFLATRVGNPEARGLINAYLQDGEEFVRRRALYAMGKHDPAAAERLAREWVTADDPHSRMAALVVLVEQKSDYLPTALEILQADSNPLVRTTARDIVRRKG